jgi:hypothetical protein
MYSQDMALRLRFANTYCALTVRDVEKRVVRLAVQKTDLQMSDVRRLSFLGSMSHRMEYLTLM